jgi:hypothetical protein
LIHINVGIGICACLEFVMWQPISIAPVDRDLELAVIDTDGTHALVFPCRRVPDGWRNTSTNKRVDVRPTHWRPWASPASR